jgi:1A family penicillin-binding protein
MLGKFFSSKNFKKLLYLAIIAFLVLGGIFLVWITTVELPDINNFENRIVAESTKIYDRTGKVVLFDVHGNVRRTVVPMDKISDYVKWATVAIEDANFYNHGGIEPSAIFRAIFVNLKEGNLLGGQGGSTITQQVIKNSLLTTDKRVTRKIKEWILAPRLESKLTKDQILEIYLNEVPYGGTVYGIQEAARRFFGKDAVDLTLVESAYLAALPQAPTYYSPYGNNLEDLEERKNKVLRSMRESQMITEDEYQEALQTKVEFERQEDYGIKAPHFVMFIREQLEEKYGVDAVEQGGLKVITTLDWELQKEAEDIVKKNALENVEKFDAENGSITAVDPNTGQILVMVGSRDYFDEEIDGNFNISTTERQPGSAFKPFVYAKAFEKGYRPETVVFDLPTEFSDTCASGGNCYSPVNYDGQYVGPIDLRHALAQSRNIPAVKVLYLAGLRDALSLAKTMGLQTLTNTDQYGLTLVLGGGEVRPLDMAGAYAVFANDGVKNETVGILSVEDPAGNKLEEYEQKEYRVLDEQVVRKISSVLSDNEARAPLFGPNSLLNFGSVDVAAKTGTTNDYRDAWIIGYTPNLSVAAWAGNNDNRSMNKKTAGLIVSPMWAEFMRFAIQKYPAGNFADPNPQDNDVKPIIRGGWNEEGEVHSILHWVNRSDPLGSYPNNPYSDSQYDQWEASVTAWANNQGIQDILNSQSDRGSIQILDPKEGQTYVDTFEMFVVVSLSRGELSTGKVYLNNEYIGSLNKDGILMFIPSKFDSSTLGKNTLRVEIEDLVGKTYTDEVNFSLKN